MAVHPPHRYRADRSGGCRGRVVMDDLDLYLWASVVALMGASLVIVLVMG
jgi:hypothetical protein